MACRRYCRNAFADMNHLIAVCQMTSTGNKGTNFETCKTLITDAQKSGAKMIFLPESFDYIVEDKSESFRLAESMDGPLIDGYKSLAKSLNVWLSLGGFHEKFSETKIRNTHLVINDDGEVCRTYRKMHLFDVDIPSKNVKIQESNTVEAGDEISPPVETPIGNVGLAICYDVRFAHMAIALAENGADILTYPSAFFASTGAQHWEVLLRGRAVETQCYVVAAAQTGSHGPTRRSWGHSMVVDPLGTVIAQCSDKPGFALARVDLSLIKDVRQSMPIERHRRYDAYPTTTIGGDGADRRPVDDADEFVFGACTVKGSQVFYRTRLCYAFVNIRCVLPGHVLVAPLRPEPKFTRLSRAEVEDLFLAVQRVQRAVERVHSANSSSIVIQDGEHAGQTVKHVHVHILPRKPGDVLENDDVYRRLQNQNHCPAARRSDGEMAAEAELLRSYV